MFKKLFAQKKLIKFFYDYQKEYLGWAIGAGALLLINVLLQLPMPLVTRYFIDHILPTQNFKLLHLVCMLLLGIILLRQVTSFFMRFILIKYKARVHFKLERDLYFHVQELPMSYFARRPSGYVLARISEVSAVEAIMADTFLYILQDIVTMVVGAVLVLNLHLELGLVSLFVLPFFIFTIKAFHKRIKDINKRLREENAQYTGKLEKNINAIEKIKSAVKEESVGQRLADKLSSVIGLRIKAQLISALAGIASGFIGLISPFVVLWYGGLEIMKGDLTLGTFFAINAFLGYLYGPAQRLTSTGYNLSQAMASLERIYEVFSEKQEEKGGEPAGDIKEIVFERVDFSYGGSVPTLKDLNLAIKSGERVAVVGESGQGKSTLVKMLLKFYQPDAGHIFFSGKDSRSIAVKSLRDKIAYISQRQRILEEEMEERIDDARVLELMEKFRFEKVLSQEAMYQSELSGGEIQKIELIESILKQADVLIVDEGTSNIDYKAEKIVLGELFDKYRDKIIIFVAHRLSSITDFERIAVIDKGRVVEQGSHDQLLKKGGKYRELWGMEQKSQETAKKTA